MEQELLEKIMQLVNQLPDDLKQQLMMKLQGDTSGGEPATDTPADAAPQGEPSTPAPSAEDQEKKIVESITNGAF